MTGKLFAHPARWNLLVTSNQLNSRIVEGELINDLGGFVGRVIVEHDHFKVFQTLLCARRYDCLGDG